MFAGRLISVVFMSLAKQGLVMRKAFSFTSLYVCPAPGFM
jgi:hypothetical protein